MIEKIRKITNPLTIIAIFAGLAEVFGTIILPFVDISIQHIYVYFIMAFPATLVVLFFLTLNFNHKVLYSPTDFKDEKNFVNLIRPASIDEIDDKKHEEINELIKSDEYKETSDDYVDNKVESETKNDLNSELNNGESKYGREPEEQNLKTIQRKRLYNSKSSIDENIIDSIKDKNMFLNNKFSQSIAASNKVNIDKKMLYDYSLIEELAIKKYQKDFGGKFTSGVAVTNKNDKKIVFDGLIEYKNRKCFLEVIYIKNLSINRIKYRLMKEVEKLYEINSMASRSYDKIELDIIMVTEMNIDNLGQDLLKSVNQNVRIHFYTLDEIMALYR